MSSDDFENTLRSALDRRKQGHDVSTETLMVMRIVRKFGLSGARVKAMSQADGVRQPTLSWFSQAFSTFPLFLGYRQTKHARDGLREMTRNFLKSTVFKSWQSVDDVNQTGRPTGCLFRWPRFGDSVVYRALDFDDRKPGLAVLVRLGKGQLFVVQHVRSWLNTLEWDTDGIRL